mmetsp:Transcript_69871/g.227384  ORF Transcript_69871/g.227384 Transcript_69871/m.227384 type:complete len:253 (-) Transcript_69871:674-1432(-)
MGKPKAWSECNSSNILPQVPWFASARLSWSASALRALPSRSAGASFEGEEKANFNCMASKASLYRRFAAVEKARTTGATLPGSIDVKCNCADMAGASEISRLPAALDVPAIAPEDALQQTVYLPAMGARTPPYVCRSDLVHCAADTVMSAKSPVGNPTGMTNAVSLTMLSTLWSRLNMLFLSSVQDPHETPEIDKRAPAANPWFAENVISVLPPLSAKAVMLPTAPDVCTGVGGVGPTISEAASDSNEHFLL